MTSYKIKEERLNVLTHGTGAIVAFFASGLLLFKATSVPQLMSLFVYCFGLMFVLLGSTFYHLAKTTEKRRFYKKLDHTAIYYLIAGTYTPFLYLNIPTSKAHYALIALWVITAIGTFFKLKFAHRFQKISLVAYLLMGWFAILIFGDMKQYLQPECLAWIIYGGIAYSVGAIFYALKKIPYTHVIWHVFVLLGAASHFIAIYFYSVPYAIH